MKNYTLLAYLNKILQPEIFKDYCPNGLQVEGNTDISKIVTGVSLNDELINHAINLNANAIIVHHGIFWYKDDYIISGIKRKRIAKLLDYGINLYAYHLPLDNHITLGNNIQLANLLDIQVIAKSCEQNLLWHGKLANALSLEELVLDISTKLNHRPLYFPPAVDKPIRHIAWCTGAADSLFNTAINLEVDVYITGEAAEPTQAMARESNVAFIAAGHYATERYGIMALGRHIWQELSIETQFIELYNPV